MVALVTERQHSPSQTASHVEDRNDLGQTQISEVSSRESYQQELSRKRKSDQEPAVRASTEQSTPTITFSETISQRQSELRGVVTNTNSLITGNESNIERIEETVGKYDESWSKLNPWSSNFWVGGAIDGQRQELQGLNSLVNETKKHRDTLEKALARSEQSLNEAQSLRDQGNVIAAQADSELAKADLLARENKHSESQLVRQEAEQLKLKSLEVLRDAQSKEVAAYAALPTEEQLRGIPEQAQAVYRESMKGVTAQYAQAIESLNTAESRVRMARDATVIIGVTVATGGVGSSAAVIAAYGTTGAAGAALVAGTAAGTAIGAAATVAEQGGAVAVGLKDGNQALADGLTQVGKDAQTSLVTSAAMVTGLGVAGKVAPKLGTVITNQVAAKVATGMASGASGSVVSTTANEAIDVGLNGKEFNGQKFATDLGKNTLAGALGGGIGASGSMMRNGTALRGSLVTGGEVLADGVVSVGIEGADSALSGREFSMAKAQEAFMQSVQGSVIGELGGKGRDLTSTTGHLAIPKAQDPQQAERNQLPNVGSSQNNSRGADGTTDIHSASKENTEVRKNTDSKIAQSVPNSTLDSFMEANPDVARLSSNGRAVYIKDPEVLRQVYVTGRSNELQHNNVEMTKIEADRIAASEGENVQAFFDKESGRLVAPALNSEMGRRARVISGSFVKHELVHMKGGSESDAYLEQGAYLANPDLGVDRIRLDLSGDIPTFRPFRPNDPSDVLTRAEVEKFVSHKYQETSPSNMQRAIGEQLTDQSWNPAMRDYFNQRSDVDLQVVQKWVEDCGHFNKLLRDKDYEQLVKGILQRDDETILVELENITKNLSSKDAGRLSDMIQDISYLNDLPALDLTMSDGGFLFRGQKISRQLGANGNLTHVTRDFMTTSRKPEGTDLYTGNGAERLAVFLKPGETYPLIPVPNHLSEIGIDAKIAALRGLVDNGMFRNLGGFATTINDEALFKPGLNLQISPRSLTGFDGRVFRPVLIQSDVPSQGEWSSVFDQFRQFENSSRN
jgi:hypothetical protein